MLRTLRERGIRTTDALPHPSSLRYRRDKWVLRRVPVALLEYPLEVLLALWGAVFGFSVVILDSVPASIDRLLPRAAVCGWGFLMFCGALTIAYGLWSKHYGSAAARGERLLGAMWIVWAVAILNKDGWDGLPGASVIVFLALLCYIRAWWLRLRDRVNREIAKAAS